MIIGTMIQQKSDHSIILIAIITLVFGFLFFALSPLRGGFPLHDSSVFLSMGRSHLDGLVLYKDIFDHKGPIIFLINALGLLIGFGSFYGVFVLQLVNLFLTLFLIQKLFKNQNSTILFVAYAVTLIFLNHGLEGGNLTEEYIILASVFSLFLYFEKPKMQGFYLIQSLLLSYVFLIKPNGITVIASIMLFQFLQDFDYKKMGKVLLIVLQSIIPFTLVFGAFYFYYHSQGAGSEFLDGLLFFNLKYISTSFLSRIEAMVELGTRFTLELLAVALSLAILVYKKAYKEGLKVLFMAAITLFSISLAGRNYPHYFLIFLPVVIFSFKLAAQEITVQEIPIKILLIPTIVIGLFTFSPNGRGYPGKDTQYKSLLASQGITKDMSAIMIGRVTQSRFFIFSGIRYQQKWFLALNHNIGANSRIVENLLHSITEQQPDLLILDESWYRRNQNTSELDGYVFSFKIPEDRSLVFKKL